MVDEQVEPSCENCDNTPMCKIVVEFLALIDTMYSSESHDEKGVRELAFVIANTCKFYKYMGEEKESADGEVEVDEQTD